VAPIFRVEELANQETNVNPTFFSEMSVDFQLTTQRYIPELIITTAVKILNAI
jgi:hypothetical protein